MHRLRRSIFGLLFILPLAGCSSEPEESKATSSTPPAGDMPASTGPTFHKDVEPILQKSCQSCHAPGKIAPFSLLHYDEAKAVASLMAIRTAERVMPPWGAMETVECKPRFGWHDDKRLSEAQIATIKAWSDAGSPEGDPSDAPPAEDPASAADGLPGVELTVEPQKPFVADGAKDVFRCFVIDPKITETRYLNGSHFIAGNPKVVHHALMFLDATGESAKLADADGGYDCFGGPGFQDAALVAAWAPGGVPNEYPPNAGMEIPAGSRLVMQIHYHPAGAAADPDSTRFQVRFTKDRPEYTAFIALLGNYRMQFPNGDGLLPGPDDRSGPEFMIPAGVKGHTETMKLTIPSGAMGAPLPELKVYGVSTHMHYVGTDMIIRASRPSPVNSEPTEECMLQTPRWDFNWQRGYTYEAAIDALPTLHTGDVLHFRCTYDNSLDNPFVKRALMEAKLTAPKDVALGETTLDEMCLGSINLLTKK